MSGKIKFLKSLPFAAQAIRKYRSYKKSRDHRLLIKQRKLRVDMELKRCCSWIEQHKDSSSVPLYSSKPLVSVIVLNRNGKKHLEILMRSLLEKSFYDSYELIVVDNASSDDKTSYYREQRKYDVFCG